jgi:hypothetical protein
MGSMVAVKGMLSMTAERKADTQAMSRMATTRLPAETLSTQSATTAGIPTRPRR